jgi:hypothetical protein
MADFVSFPDEAEVRTIKTISGKTITFDIPLQHKHYAGV